MYTLKTNFWGSTTKIKWNQMEGYPEPASSEGEHLLHEIVSSRDLSSNPGVDQEFFRHDKISLHNAQVLFLKMSLV